MKKIIVFYEQIFSEYLDMLVNDHSDECEIVRIFAVGRCDAHYGPHKIYPLEELTTEKLDFDYIIIFSSMQDVILAAVERLYPDKQYEILDIGGMERKCLNGRGKLRILKNDVEIKCPRDVEHLIMGDFTYYTSLRVLNAVADNPYNCVIGKFCSIGENFRAILGGEHRTNWNTTYPFDELINGFDLEEKSTYSKGDIVIGNDVWIGTDVTVLSGVTIGDGCIIGSNAVVSYSLPPYSIAVGNPCKIVKKRFSDEDIGKMEEMKWWDWPYDKLYDALKMLQSSGIDALYEYWKIAMQGR